MVYEKSPSEDRPKPLGEDLAETVGAKEDRKLRSRREQDRNLWSWLGMMGLVGWAVAVPTLVGIAGGIWIDTHFPRVGESSLRSTATSNTFPFTTRTNLSWAKGSF